jgi:hypothetical protein
VFLSPLRSLWMFTLVLLFAAALSADEQVDSAAAGQKTVREILAKFDKGDPGWKLRMEAWVRLMKAGPAAVPILEEARKKESLAVSAFATQILAVMRGPAAIPKAVTDYDLSALDSAQLGHFAPDFSLTDVSGKAYRLSQFRGKKAVVLTFFKDDG